jgi:hypothetical protein
VPKRYCQFLRRTNKGKETIMSEEKKPEGWAFLWNSKKWHYFRDCRSLCGRWLCLSYDVEKEEKIDSPDNCAECRRRRLKELAKMEKKEGDIKT